MVAEEPGVASVFDDLSESKDTGKCFAAHVLVIFRADYDVTV